MNVSTPASREASRMRRRTRKESDETLRDAAQEHLNARQRRLEAYVESLRVAVSKNPGPDHTARLERLLVRARRDVDAAGQNRIPRAGITPNALAALSLPRTPQGEPNV